MNEDALSANSTDVAASVRRMGAVVIGRLRAADARIGGWHRRRSPVLAWLLRALALIILGAGALMLRGVDTTSVIEASEIEPLRGHSYIVSLRPVLPILRVKAGGGASRARLFEDGREIGPGGSRRVDIAEKGEGRFKLKRQGLIFSASDNSDPRANGRGYSVEHRVQVRPLFVGLLLALFLWILLGGRAGAAEGSYRALLQARIENFLFGVPIGFWLPAVLATLALVLLVALAGTNAVGYAILSGIKGLARNLTIMGFSAAAAIALIRMDGTHPKGILLAVLRALVLMLLAIGVEGKVLSSVQLKWAVIGALAYAVSRLQPQWRAWTDAQIERWTAKGRDDGKALAKRIVATSALLGLAIVLTNVVRYWDQSGWMDSHTYDLLAHSIATGRNLYGSGTYMPVYQYGMAALYWAFGHFFFVQQAANVLLAVLTVVFVACAAWVLFRRPAVVLAAGLVAINLNQLHHATWYTQIESWYVPAFAGSVLALAHYLERRDVGALAVLAVAAAVVFNTRLQGGLYAGALGLAVFFVVGLTLRQRIRQFVIYCLLFFAIGVAPYSIRNWVVEGRFSPSSRQSVIWLAVYNDPRVKLHGVRFWDGSVPVLREWQQNYPDSEERFAAQKKYFYDRLLKDPGYFIGALPWRLASMYGLLPFGAVDREFKPMDWAADGWRFVEERSRAWALIVVSIVGWLALVNSPTNLLFAGLILANILPGISTGQSEARLSYTVLILHLMLGLGVFGRYAVEARTGALAGRLMAWKSWFLAAAIMLLLALPIARVVVGKQFAYRAIPTGIWLPREAVSIEQTLPLLDVKGNQLTVDGSPVTSLEIGHRYRVRLRITAIMHPPKHACCFSDFDKQLRDNDRVQYYFGYISGISSATGTLAVRFEGVEVVAPLLEESTIEAVVKIEAEPKYPYPARYWAHVEKARLVSHPGRPAGS